MTSRTSVTIVGASVAGLTLASALDPSRFEVTLKEERPERDQSGSALGIWPSALRALHRVGAGAAVVREAMPVEYGAIRDLSGRPLAGGVAPPIRMVPRGVLMAALTGAVPDTVRRETALVRDATSLPGDIVIGADGVRSVVRREVTPHTYRDRSGPRQTPYLALRGLLNEPVDATEVGEYWGRGVLFGIVRIRGGAYWFTSHRSRLGPEPLDVDMALAETRRRFASAAPIITRTLDAAGSETLAQRIWVAPPLARYAHGRYVVIGDAAHAMTPNLGRGACDAILDAVSLADALNADRGLARWQARRVPVTQAARLASGALMRVALADGIRAALRDKAFRALPSAPPALTSASRS